MSVRKSEKSFRFESLESRSVMAASALAAFVKTAAPLSGFAGSLKGAPPAFVAPAAKGSSSVGEIHAETKLVATINDPTGASLATGSAKYEQETERGVTKTEIKVQVQGALPDTKLDVTLTTPATATTPETSVVIGQIVTDANGNGTLVIKTSSAKPGSVTLPTVDTTTIVKIGSDLSGTLAKPTKPTKPEKPEKPESDAKVTRIGATLSDSTGVSTLKAGISYESVTRNGTTMSVFRVCVSGGTADQVVDVTISSTDPTTGEVTKTLVGSIKLDAKGNGQLLYTTNTVLKGIAQPFPKDFPAIIPGLTVQVDTLTGTLTTVTKKPGK